MTIEKIERIGRRLMRLGRELASMAPDDPRREAIDRRLMRAARQFAAAIMPPKPAPKKPKAKGRGR